jgi:hypothetical protein
MASRCVDICYRDGGWGMGDGGWNTNDSKQERDRKSSVEGVTLTATPRLLHLNGCKWTVSGEVNIIRDRWSTR